MELLTKFLPADVIGLVEEYAEYRVHPCSHLIKSHKHSINREIKHIVQRLEGIVSYDKDEHSLIVLIKEGIEDFENRYYWLYAEHPRERDFTKNTKIFKPTFN